MKRVRQLLALLLAALWVPATAHCSLEAAGCDFGHACALGASAGHEPDSGCDDCAVCQTVEHGYVASDARVTVTVPLEPGGPSATTPSAPVHSLNAPGRPVVSWGDVGPPRPWQFAVRAAPSPRAPSFLA